MESVMEVLGDNVIRTYKCTFLSYFRISNKLAWNEHFLEGKIIERISEEITLHYWSFGVPLLWKRDFLLVRRISHQPNGSCIIAERSVEHGFVEIELRMT